MLAAIIICAFTSLSWNYIDIPYIRSMFVWGIKDSQVILGPDVVDGKSIVYKIDLATSKKENVSIPDGTYFVGIGDEREPVFFQMQAFRLLDATAEWGDARSLLGTPFFENGLGVTLFDRGEIKIGRSNCIKTPFRNIGVSPSSKKVVAVRSHGRNQTKTNERPIELALIDVSRNEIEKVIVPKTKSGRLVFLVHNDVVFSSEDTILMLVDPSCLAPEELSGVISIGYQGQYKAEYAILSSFNIRDEVITPVLRANVESSGPDGRSSGHELRLIGITNKWIAIVANDRLYYAHKNILGS